MSEIIVKNIKTNQMLPKKEWRRQFASLHQSEILFLTENENKFNELKSILKDESIRLEWLKRKITEIQDADSLSIVQNKCESARNMIADFHPGAVVLVEDVCLEFKALNGLPGPYIKWFLDSLGPLGLTKLLAGFEDKRAEAVCTYAILQGDFIIFCRGSVEGKIVEPRGESWGWDPIFEPRSGSGKTFGEMDSEIKATLSHRAVALNKLMDFLRMDFDTDKIIVHDALGRVVTDLGPLKSVDRTRIVFVTGRSEKHQELVKQMMGHNVQIIHRPELELTEIQHDDPLEIAKAKCLEARKLLSKRVGPKTIVMVDDSGLEFTALGPNVPGPYIKYFVDNMELSKFSKMLSPFNDTRAVARCTYCLSIGDYIVFCRGFAYGKIVEPRGVGWAWGPIFEDCKLRKTYGEFSEEETTKYGLRANASNSLKEFLKMSSISSSGDQ